MSKNIIVIFVLFFISYISSGQENPEKNGYSKSHLFDSKYLNEKRVIEIYFPPSYQKLEGKNYPVMYIMDGQEYFLHPIAYQRMLRFKDKSPEFIVVGIDSDRKRRRRLYYEDADKFINFLKEELIPFIDLNYKTLKEKERIYFGWEMAGGLGLDFFNHHPSLFNAYFLASPTHLSENRIVSLDQNLKNTTLQNSYLYLTKASEETYIQKAVNKIDSIFRIRSSMNMLWKIDNLLNEDHYTTPLKTVNNGLRDYFKDYNTLRFYSLKEYDEFGDLNEIKKYYKQRGNRYGISPEVHRTTQHFLLLNSMTENNFIRFEVYANEFKEYFQNLKLEIWAIKFGNYYAKNGKGKEALNIYNEGLKKFPKSAAINNAIGAFYKEKGNRHKAEIYYKNAIELTDINDEEKLKKYQNDLEKL